MAEKILLGYTHTGVLGMLHPEVAYPNRKVKASPSVITLISRDPCRCPDEHLEIWVEPREVDEQLRLFY
jgi:hypothetical protein